MQLKFWPYIFKNLWRNRLRTMMTLAAITTAMFLFCFLQSLQDGLSQVTDAQATRNLFIVFQQNRFCPSTSRLPERYAETIKQLPGVKEVLPIRLYVNNCRANLDMVTFRGVPADKLKIDPETLTVTTGSIEQFVARNDAALVGERLAARRRLKVGDIFQLGELRVVVAGLFTSQVPGEESCAYTHLDYLQRALGKDSIGMVTQFNVRVSDPSQAEALAAQIDDMFRSEAVPTTTRSHKAFASNATGDLIEIIGFSRYLGYICLFVVLMMVANTIYLAVRDRVKEHAVLQTIGFSGYLIFSLILAESLLVSIIGGMFGAASATLLLKFSKFGIGTEGIQIDLTPGLSIIVSGLIISMIIGVLAGTFPALQASRSEITDSLRRV